MKVISFFLFFLHYFSIALYSQPNTLQPIVDKRVELLSIVFQLAGAPDIQETHCFQYKKDIQRHFAPYAKHRLVEYIHNTFFDSLKRDSVEYNYWIIPAIAVHLIVPPDLSKIKDSNFVDDPWDDCRYLSPQMAFMVQQFYKDADCESFFRNHEPYYKKINDAYQEQGNLINKEWIASFFGLTPSENYHAIVALNLKNGAYLRVNPVEGNRNTFSIFGCTGFDEEGMPTTFKEPYFKNSMLHEFIHCFSNQLIDKHSKELRPYAESILNNTKVFKLMQNTFYGNWQYLLYESMVRACTIKYLMINEKDQAVAENEIMTQEKAGFFWIKGLVNRLNRYENNRKGYKNMESLMPEIINFFKTTATEMQSEKE
ncbi:MAG: DUF4932 domain-containing protein [Ferruginibacter sp.]